MWFFPSFGIRPGRKVTGSKVLQVLRTRESIMFLVSLQVDMLFDIFHYMYP